MTIDEYKQYYSNLLIAQYRSKPKAKAHIEALIKPIGIDLLPLAVQSAFNLETAEGIQLDTVGQYVGASRTVVGPNSLKVVLSDADYRVLIKLAVIKNTSHSTLGEIQDLIAAFFADNILITDNTIMQLNYFIGEGIGSTDLQYALLYGDYLPRPMAVQTSVVVVPPFTAPYFGMRTYSSGGVNISPFNSYDLYNTNAPWLSYTT
jgi:hypothetical protein